MSKVNSERVCRCAVCGIIIQNGQFCDRCEESFALCEMEEYSSKKLRGKNKTEREQTLCNRRDLW